MIRRDLVTTSDGTITLAPAVNRSTRRAKKPKEAAPLPLFNRDISDDMLARIRSDFPGWDVYQLKAEFNQWIYEQPDRMPKNFEAAFYGFVRQHAARNRS
jgi:hypothetical protein